MSGNLPVEGETEWLGIYSVSDMYSFQIVSLKSDGTYSSRCESCSKFSAETDGVWTSSQDWIEFIPDKGVDCLDLPSGKFWKKVKSDIHCLVPVEMGARDFGIEFVREFLSKDSDRVGVNLPYRLNPEDAFNADAWGSDG